MSCALVRAWVRGSVVTHGASHLSLVWADAQTAATLGPWSLLQERRDGSPRGVVAWDAQAQEASKSLGLPVLLLPSAHGNLSCPTSERGACMRRYHELAASKMSVASCLVEAGYSLTVADADALFVGNLTHLLMGLGRVDLATMTDVQGPGCARVPALLCHSNSVYYSCSFSEGNPGPPGALARSPHSVGRFEPNLETTVTLCIFPRNSCAHSTYAVGCAPARVYITAQYPISMPTYTDVDRLSFIIGFLVVAGVMVARILEMCMSALERDDGPGVREPAALKNENPQPPMLKVSKVSRDSARRLYDGTYPPAAVYGPSPLRTSGRPHSH